jgi:hypothetical protein
VVAANQAAVFLVVAPPATAATKPNKALSRITCLTFTRSGTFRDGFFLGLTAFFQGWFLRFVTPLRARGLENGLFLFFFLKLLP